MDEITFKGSGSFKNMESFLRKLTHTDLYHKIQKYGEKGVRELSKNTPVRTGATAESWDWEAIKTDAGVVIAWTNSNAPNGIPVPYLLEYGHSARDGSWVPAQPFVERTMSVIFEEMANDIWKGVVE